MQPSAGWQHEREGGGEREWEREGLGGGGRWERWSKGDREKAGGFKRGREGEE